MKMQFYDLFEDGVPEQEPAAENVKIRTLRKIEQERTPAPLRPLRRVLIAAVLVIALVGGAFAAPAIWNALTSVRTVQAGKGALQLTEHGVLAKAGYLEITPEITKNENAPEAIERYFVPGLCADWEPVTQYYSTEEAPTMQKDAGFAWKLPGGDYVLLRQFTLTDYNSDHSFDTVSLGFGSDYTLSEQQYGELPVQCVAVPPSEYPEPVSLWDEHTFYQPGGFGGYSDETLYQYDLGGVHFDVDEDAGLARMYYRGLRKLYWSDGDYLFILEVNYDMAEETLTAILESLQPVDDFRPYVRMEYLEPVIEESISVSTPLFPGFVPEGWTLMDSESQTESACTWIWSYQDRSGMELLQESNTDTYDCELLDWLGSVDPYESYETAVGDWTVTVFESEFKTSLLWKTETDCFVLSSSGPDRLNAQTLLQIAESLQPIPTP